MDFYKLSINLSCDSAILLNVTYTSKILKIYIHTEKKKKRNIRALEIEQRHLADWEEPILENSLGLGYGY